MSVTAILGFIQLARFSMEQIELYNNGDITEEELDERWDKTRERVQQANELWEGDFG